MPDYVSEPIYKIFKHAMDFTLGVLGIIFFAFLYPFVSLPIKLDSRGPVLVKLKRISAGRPIFIYKFRSMVANAEELGAELKKNGKNERVSGPFFKMKRDPRITRVGRVLRKYRLDEFPQFINVLQGNMSIVGPRPHQPDEVREYPPEFAGVPLEKAGITGLSQVSGASTLSFKRELELDTQYINHKSAWLDIKIIFKTIAIMVKDPTAV